MQQGYVSARSVLSVFGTRLSSCTCTGAWAFCILFNGMCQLGVSFSVALERDFRHALARGAWAAAFPGPRLGNSLTTWMLAALRGS